MNMVRCFEDAGAAAVHLEDQLLPKKCGHLNDKKLAAPADMAAKVAAAAKARRHLFAMGHRMVIWPVSSLRVAARATERLYAAIAADGGAHNQVDQMQTRRELYATIGYQDYEALDASIVATIIAEALPQVPAE